jgi:CheY-like chemotaxis protein
MNRPVEILVVEDSPTQAAQLQNLLEECGYVVRVATNGLRALASARSQKPDLVISDIVMPEMDGYQLCKEIKADDQLRDIPVVLVTSLSSPQDVIKGLGCGADSFIRKPYEEKYLISRIEYLRANRVLRQQEQGQMGLEMYLGGQRHFITAERQQILDLLISTYTEAIRLNEGLNRSNQWLHGLYRIAEGLNQAEDEHRVCEMAVAGAVELPGIQASWIVLDGSESSPRLVVAEGVPADLENLESLQSHATVTLWAGDQIYGAMNLVAIDSVEFTREDLSILQGVGNQVGIALERAHLRSHLEQMVEERTSALRAEVVERKAAEEDAEYRLGQLHVLHAIDKAIINVQELPVSLDTIVKQIAAQLGVDAVNVMLYDSPTQSLSYGAGVGFTDNFILNFRKRLGEGHVGHAVVGRQLDYVPDLSKATDFKRAPWLQREGFVSYFGVPLVVQDELKGVLEVFHRAPLDPKPEWLEFLQALALQTAIAIAHAQLFSQTRHLLQRTQEEARKVRQVMDTVPEGVIFLDHEHCVELANETGELYLSLLANTKVGEPLTHLGEHPLDDLVNDARKVAWHELSIKEGRHIFEIAARPMQVNSDADGWVLVLREVTHERHNQQRMQVQERLATVGQLAAGIAHDFNNLLVPIVLYSELMISTVPRESRMWGNLDKILLAANRAKELVRQILAFSRQTPLQQREPVQLQRQIKDVLQLLSASLPPTITVHQQIAPHVGSVLANPVEIHQVLMNLCTNAYHAMQKSGGVLTIQLDKINVDPDFVASRAQLKLGPYVRVIVSDTGHGMEPATMERIFDPFFTTKAAGQGTGMGLSVVYGIVMSYGGDILVESVPGHGTTFSIYLPELPASAENEEESHPPLTGGTERILLVDDEEGIVHVTETLLSSLGYAVTVYTSSKDALESFRQHPNHFDLVITDLTMPEMDGLALSKKLREIRTDLPILLISGAHENVTTETAAAIGVDISLMKPFLTHELSSRIRQLFTQHSSIAKE